MNEIISIDKGLCSLTETSAKLKGGLDFKAWCEVGKSLSRASRSLQWWIGDWLNYGVKEYGSQRAMARDHADALGIGEDMLRATMWVAEKVANRIASLSWSHHREVCGLSPKEQKQWLKQAEDNKWSVSDLRQSIRQSGADEQPHDSEHTAAFNPLRFALDFNRWAKGADVARMGVEQRQCLKRDLKPIVEFWQRL
jgi:uncharacterized protein YukE